MDDKNKQKEYIFMWSQTPIIPSSWGTVRSLRERRDIYKNGGSIFSYFNGKIITTYIPKEDLEIRKNTESKAYLSPDFFKKYQKRYKKEMNKWWKWIRKIEKKDYSNISINQLKKDHWKFQEYMRDAIAYFGSTRPEYTYQVEEKLKKYLKKRFANEWDYIYGILLGVLELDDIQKEYLERLKLVNSGITEKKINNHISKFPWLVSDYLEEKKGLSLIKNLFNKEKGIYPEEKKKLKEKKERLKQEQEKIYKQLGKDGKEVRYLSRFLQIQALERMNIKSYWAGCYYLSKDMWFKIADVLDLKVGDILKFIIPPEIQELLKKDYKNNIDEIIKLRKKSHAINYEKGGKKIRILTDEEAYKLFKQKVRKPSLKGKTIKGQTASFGIYKGKARKVIAGNLETLKDSVKKFKKGEVLVTSMTQPNMMVIVKRAGAIVADEGGITSHAAIISREIKIPCIVGCLKAMQVLNDGDLIEVDANKGVVNLIKTKKK